MKFKNILFGCIGLLFVSLIVILQTGNYISAPRNSKILSPPNELFAQKVTFNSESGANISGWYVPGETTKGGILLMHGVKANRLQMLGRATFLNKEGYSVLLFDFQGHGESTGKQITFGYLESLDANAGLVYLEERLTNKSIGVIGVSLGGASALIGEVLTKSDAIILESVYPTIEEAISNRLTMRLGFIGKFFTPLLTWQIKPRLGFYPSELRPIEYISRAKAPVFVIAGSDDKHTTLAESNRLFQKAREPKSFWEIKGAAHVDFYNYNPNEYKLRVLEFFNKNIKNIKQNHLTSQ